MNIPVGVPAASCVRLSAKMAIVCSQLSLFVSFFRCSIALAEMPSPPAHLALRGERDVRLSNRVSIIVVFVGLRKEENILVIDGWASRNRRGHRVGLMPDNVSP